MEKEKQYIQVGMTALRGPMGEFYESVPLYIQVEKVKAPLHPVEKNLLHSVSGVFAELYFEIMQEKRKTAKHSKATAVTIGKPI